MGNLTPGATLVYESPDGGKTVYAREAGKTERQLVGYSYQRDPLDYRNYQSTPAESQLWHEIRIAARTDKNLQDALDRAKILYYLKNPDKKPLDWHPV